MLFTAIHTFWELPLLASAFGFTVRAERCAQGVVIKDAPEGMVSFSAGQSPNNPSRIQSFFRQSLTLRNESIVILCHLTTICDIYNHIIIRYTNWISWKLQGSGGAQRKKICTLVHWSLPPRRPQPSVGAPVSWKWLFSDGSWLNVFVNDSVQMRLRKTSC